MRNAIVAALLAVAGPALAGPVPPVGCPTCIQNTASPQEAQINIGTGTIRGTLTVSTLNVTNLAITTLSATNIVGAGSGITALNASALASGTVPSARLSGAYAGITGVGTVAAGVWNGTAVGTQYGGTGQNWSAVNRGALPFFNGTGTLGTLAAGTVNYLLQAGGAGADPSWTSAPTVLGTNVSAIPLANLVTGNLPSAIKATDASLVSVSGSKVSGDIAGNAANISGNLPLNQLVAGTLPTTVAASSITPTGVTAGTYPATTARVPVLVVRGDGRISSASQSDIALPLSQLNSGTLPGGIFIPAAGVADGNLGAGVVAQTLNNIGTPAGTFGGPTFAAQVTTDNQGRVTNIAQFAIPTVSTRTAWIDQDNYWHGPGQTSRSSWTFLSDARVEGTLTLDNPLAVTSGGTGRASLTANALLYGSGTSAPVSLPVLGNGGLVIGTGAAPSTGTLTGTVNQVTVTNAPGAITLSLPQDLAAASSPTFAALTLTAALPVASGGSGQQTLATHGVLLGQGTSGLHATAALGAAGIVVGTGTGVDPSTGTLAGTANQVVVTQTGAGLVLSLPQSINSGATPTFTGTNFSGIPAGAILAGGLGNGVIVSTNNFASGFNGASELVQLNGSGNLPALNAAALTALTAANISAGTAGISISGTAALATAVAGGLVGQLPYQTSAGVTAFLPSMGAAGIVVGNGVGVVPSTATLTGTTNRITVTQSGTAVTLTTPQDIQSGAAPTFAATNFTGTGASMTAGAATNLAAGLIGQTPYQTGAGATAFLPAMAAGGIITGNGTSAVPSTGTFSGTANQVVVTRTGSNIVLSTPQNINSGATPTFTGTNFSGIPAGTALTGQVPIANGGTNLSSAGGTANRVLRTSDGSTFTMGQVTGPDIAVATIPVAALNQSGASDGQVISWSASASAWQPTSSSLTHGTTQFYSTNTWTTPTGISCVTLWGCAAGASGGSGGGTVGSGAGGGGGAGEMIYAPCFPVTAGAVNSINMGGIGVSTGTTLVANGFDGNNGGDLTFGNALSSATAQGGRAGKGNNGNTAGVGGAGGGPTGGVGGISGSGNGNAGTSDTYVLLSSGPVVHIGGASGGGGGNGAVGGNGGPSTRQGGYLGGVPSGASSGAAYAGGGGGGGGGFTGAGGNGYGYTGPTLATAGAGYCSGGGGGGTGGASAAGAPGYIKISW